MRRREFIALAGDVRGWLIAPCFKCLRIPDKDSLTSIVSWLDLVKGLTLKLSAVFYQSNLSN
jgi:hypothetical protein